MTLDAHSWSFGRGRYERCLCGAARDVTLRDNATVRLYRSSPVAGWSDDAPPCPSAPLSMDAICFLAHVLDGAFPDIYGAEVVDGHMIAIAAEDVDLDVECSPVVLAKNTITPVEARRLSDGSFEIVAPDEDGDFSVDFGHPAGRPIVAAAQDVRRMRARYLLRRVDLRKKLPSLDAETRTLVEPLYFGPRVGEPAAGSIRRVLLEVVNGS